MMNKNSIKLLEDLDNRKARITLSYLLDSGRVVSTSTIIRALVEKDNTLFVLTESGEPIAIHSILSVREIK